LAVHRGDLGDTEIEHAHLHLPYPISWLEKEVARLDVTMDEPGAMAGPQASGGLVKDLQRGGESRRAFAREAGREVLPSQQLHDQEIQPQLAVDSVVVYGYHVWVVHGCRFPSLAQEAGMQACLRLDIKRCAD